MVPYFTLANFDGMCQGISNVNWTKFLDVDKS